MLTVAAQSILYIYVVTWWLVIFELDLFITDDAAKRANPFISSMYLTIITMTTVGYGDITPRTNYGRILVMIAAIIGVCCR